jgi:hypothetical protein
MAVNFAYNVYFLYLHSSLTGLKILQHGIFGFTSPMKEVVQQIFITIKNPSLSAWFKPANLGSSGKHSKTKPLRATFNYFIM